MSKEIKKRDGFFKLFHRYSTDDSFKKRKEDLEKEDIKLEKKDRLALALSAFLVIFLPAMVLLGVTILIALLIFGFFK